MLQLVAERIITLEQGVAALSTKPAQILRLDSGALSPGFAADICIFDPEQTWQVNAENWHSQGVNTPYWGQTLKGRVNTTLQAGNVIYGLDKRS